MIWSYFCINTYSYVLQIGPVSNSFLKPTKKYYFIIAEPYDFLCMAFQMGQFYYAAKAFDVLERLDPNPEYWEGKRGACVGVFQMIIANHEPK